MKIGFVGAGFIARFQAVAIDRCAVSRSQA